jgi:hypothetical protein
MGLSSDDKKGFYGTRKIFISMTTFLVPNRECYVFWSQHLSHSSRLNSGLTGISTFFPEQPLLTRAASAKPPAAGDHRADIFCNESIFWVLHFQEMK